MPQSERQGPANGREDIYLPVTPYGKPRMTRRDQWAKRPAVIRYRAFCDAVRAAWPAGVPYPAAGAHVTFWLPMPKSWSNTTLACEPSSGLSLPMGRRTPFGRPVVPEV